MAGFVRVAAKEKAQVLLEREARLTLTERDFKSFAHALDTAFAPNAALKDALTQARAAKRSADRRLPLRRCQNGAVAKRSSAS
jgi:uncharacterized protein (DUF1778 family)